MMRSPQLRDPLWILQAKALDQHRCNSILLFTEPCAKKNTNHPTSCADAARCFMVFHGVFQLFGSFWSKNHVIPSRKNRPSSQSSASKRMVLGGRWPVRCTACLPRFCKQRAVPSGILKGLAQWQTELMAGHFVYHDVGSLGELGDWKL